MLNRYRPPVYMVSPASPMQRLVHKALPYDQLFLKILKKKQNIVKKGGAVVIYLLWFISVYIYYKQITVAFLIAYLFLPVRNRD